MAALTIASPHPRIRRIRRNCSARITYWLGTSLRPGHVATFDRPIGELPEKVYMPHPAPVGVGSNADVPGSGIDDSGGGSEYVKFLKREIAFPS